VFSVATPVGPDPTTWLVTAGEARALTTRANQIQVRPG
jgi:hypothetical protein